jgi:AcrR family transcriptional regulator
VKQELLDNRPKRERDPEAKKRRICDAATVLFVDQGFFPTTLADVAKAANVSKSTILLHFGTMANLARELALHHFKLMGEELGTLIDRSAGVEQHVRVGTANYVRWCAANPYPARFLLAMRHQEFLENPDLPRQVAEETSKGSVELIRIGQSEGSIRSGDPEFLAHMYSAPAQKMVQMKLELGIGGDLVEMADAAGDLSWRMLCQPIEPEEREM